jgi:ribose 5-phosphate isomerase B
MEKIKIALGADHAGYAYKAKFIEYLTSLGYECVNCGTDSAESVDYPIYADKVCKQVTDGGCKFGILICGTGIGMSMAANKHHAIRAALCGDVESAKLTRMHNDANVLCLGARIIDYDKAKEILDAFLGQSFMGEHHIRRVKMLDELI